MEESRRSLTLMVLGILALGASLLAPPMVGQDLGPESSSVTPQPTAFLAGAGDEEAAHADGSVGVAHAAARSAEAQNCLLCATEYDLSDPDPAKWTQEHRFDSTGDPQNPRSCMECHNEWREGGCINSHPPCIMSSLDEVRENVTTAVALRLSQDPSSALAEIVAANPELRLSSDGRELWFTGCDGSTHQRWRVDTARGLVLHEVD